MELRNYENLINDHEKKLALLNQELLRLNEILKDKDERDYALFDRLKKECFDSKDYTEGREAFMEKLVERLI